MGSIAQQILRNMGSQIEVYVTSATPDRQSGLFKFWTQLDPEGLDQVEQQVGQFQSMAQMASSPLPDSLGEGKLCIAKYLEDGRWYRARIESVTGNDVIAFFIDYGNTEIIPRSLVRTKEAVGNEVFAVPAQATACVLSGVTSVMQHRTIKMGTHGHLKDLLVDQTFIGEAQQLTKDGLEMKLFTQSGDNVAELIIHNGFGVVRGPGMAIPPPVAAQEQMPRGFTHLTLSVGSCENLYVSNVDNLGQFWVQQASKSEELDNLMDSIGAQYDGLGSGEKALGAAKEGSACIATFSADGVNYRAVVTKVQGSKQCTVQFVDFGNAEVKDADSLKLISDDLLSHPAIAVECALSGINTDSCSSRAVERFEELTAEKELYGKVVGMKGKACSVLLIDPQGEVDIINVLVKEGLVSRGEEHFSQLTSPTSPRAGANVVSCNGGGDSHAVKSYIDSKISRGSKAVVEIIAVRGVDDFSCQLMEEAEAFNVMMDKIQSDYSTASSGTVKSPQIHQPCCVRFSEDNCWYRARVVSINGKQVQVQYVDYGNGEMVDSSNLKQLKPEFLTLPVQCIDCILDGVPKLEGEEAEKAVSWLDGHTEENMVASINGVRDDRYVVVLKSQKDGTVLNEDIKKILPRQKAPMKKTPPRAKHQQEDAQPLQRTPPKAQLKGSTKSASATDTGAGCWSKEKLSTKETDVYISHVEDPRKFFCQLVSQEEKLNILMDEIQTKCAQSMQKQLQHACIGTPCVAQFSEDKSWYRAVITDQKPGCLRVCFVDYGNEEDVPLEHVREITADLMTLPQQAVPCFLSGWDSAWSYAKVDECMKSLAAQIEKFRMTVRESQGMAVVNLKWQGKDMLQELKKVRDSIPKETKQPQKAATPPRQKEKPVNTTPPFTIPSAIESVSVNKPVMMAASVVKGPTKFFCQLCSQYDKLQQLSGEMNNHYAQAASSKDTLTSPMPGFFCAAKSSSDGAWYRAKILHTASSGAFKVKFVDYGDDDVLPLASLCNLLPKFQRLPTQAIKCRLSGVMKKFEAVVLDREVTVLVKAKQDGKLEVEYQDDGLRAEVQGVFGPVAQVASVPSKGVPPQLQPTPQQSYIRQDSPGGQTQDVYVSHVDSLHKFYVQMCSRSDEIDMLQQKLKTSYSSSSSGPASSTAVGTACCAKFSEDGDWYRAVVTQQPSPGKAVVQFVDFGNSEEQSASDLRPLKPEFLQQAVAAIECKLKDVSSTSPEASNEFLGLTFDKSLKCEFHGKEEPYQVDFQELQAETRKWQEAAVQEAKPTPKSFPTSKQLTKGTREEVYVSSIVSPAVFWCQLARQESNLNTLMDSIDAYYSSLPPAKGQFASPEIGAACVAKFSDDEGWYRARITEVHPDTCTVFFVDYGNSDKVSKSYIMEIKDEFLMLEQLAIRCSLGGVSPVGSSWNEEASDAFGSLSGDKKLLAEVIEVDASTPSRQIMLLDLGMSLAKSLIEQGQATAVPSATKAIRFASESDELPGKPTSFKTLDIRQGSTEKVYVTVVNSLHEFYCQVAARATEDLDPLSGKLQAEAPSLTDITSESILGVPCIAKFTDDEQWYRATVVADQGENVDVFFVDYGNRESVPRSQVKGMTEAFSALPAQSMKCALARVPRSHSSNDSAVAEFENLVLESEALMAEFVGRKGDTWIVKLLNDGQPVAESLGLELLGDISESPLDSQPNLSAPPDLSYSWPSLEARQVVEVFVTAVNSPEDFYCQSASTEDDLNILMDNIQSIVIPMGDNPQPQDVDLKPGRICLAQCAQDGYWYRSEVMQVTGDTVKVMYVDTGKTDSVPSVKVRAMDPDFLDLKRQSFRCQLAGISPKGQSWDKDATNAFKKLTSDHSLMADILKVETSLEGAVTSVIVKLQDGAVSVADLLTEKGHACETAVPKFAAEEATEDSFDASIIVTPCWEGQKYKQSALQSGERQEVVILSVTGPAEFYCRPLDFDLSGMPGKIRFEVERHAGEMIGQSRLTPAKNMPCVAKCKDGTWKRIEILDVLGQDQAKVFLVDEAQTQVVPISNLQLITSTLLGLPLQAVKCSLEAPPSEFEWSEADMLTFREMLDGNTLQAELVDGGVQLYSDDESVWQLLIKRAEDRKAQLLAEREKLVVDSSEAADENDGTQTEIPAPEEDNLASGVDLTESFKQAFKTLDLKVDQDVTLCLVTVDSPDEITCQITHTAQKVLDIEQQMTEIYGEESEIPKDTDWLPKVGEPCAAKHSEYEDWYRATVVSVDQETGVEVFYADYGGTDRVPFESVRMLNDELRQIPAQAIKFRLNKPLMPLTMWNKKTKAILEGQDMEQDLHAKILGVDERLTLIELLVEDFTFFTNLVDQSQTGSLCNENENDDKDEEFFDSVDQLSTETEEGYEAADIDDALQSISAQDDASPKTGEDIEGTVAAVIEDLFEKAAEQVEADQIQSDIKSDDASGGTTEGSPAVDAEENNSAAQKSGIPEALVGTRMISMKDILDHFVDCTLQNQNQDHDEHADNNEKTDEPRNNGENLTGQEEGDHLSGDEDETEDLEVPNGEIDDEPEETPLENQADDGSVEDDAQGMPEKDQSPQGEEPGDSVEISPDQLSAGDQDSGEQATSEVPSRDQGQVSDIPAQEETGVQESSEEVTAEQTEEEQESAAGEEVSEELDSSPENGTEPLPVDDQVGLDSAKEATETEVAADEAPAEDSQQIDEDQEPDGKQPINEASEGDDSGEACPQVDGYKDPEVHDAAQQDGDRTAAAEDPAAVTAVQQIPGDGATSEDTPAAGQDSSDEAVPCQDPPVDDAAKPSGEELETETAQEILGDGATSEDTPAAGQDSADEAVPCQDPPVDDAAKPCGEELIAETAQEIPGDGATSEETPTAGQDPADEAVPCQDPPVDDAAKSSGEELGAETEQEIPGDGATSEATPTAGQDSESEAVLLQDPPVDAATKSSGEEPEAETVKSDEGDADAEPQQAV